MAELTINNIKFSNINTNQKVTGNSFKNVKTAFTTDGKFDADKLNEKIKLVESGTVDWANFGFVNAVEIDWNGMVLGDKTINTTGELLSN